MKDQPVYIMVPRKFIWTWIAVAVTFFALVMGSYWYSYYNASRWCNIVTIFDEGYTQEPPQSATGKLLAPEMHKLRNDYRC